MFSGCDCPPVSGQMLGGKGVSVRASGVAELPVGRTTMVLGGQGCLPVQGGLLANSANSSSPILIDDLILGPHLLLFGLLLLCRLHLGCRARPARCSRDGVMATYARACGCSGGRRGRDGLSWLGRHGGVVQKGG